MFTQLDPLCTPEAAVSALHFAHSLKGIIIPRGDVVKSVGALYILAAMPEGNATFVKTNQNEDCLSPQSIVVFVHYVVQKGDNFLSTLPMCMLCLLLCDCCGKIAVNGIFLSVSLSDAMSC